MAREGRADDPLELGRLAALDATGLRPPVVDEVMERLAALACRLVSAEIALVSLIDDECQYFPGQHGLTEPWSSTRRLPLHQSICRFVVTSDDVVQIDDTTDDPRAEGRRGVLGIGAYLGVPLRDAEGHVLGSLCAITAGPRPWSAVDRENLVDLAFGVSSELKARIAATDADDARRRAERSRHSADRATERLRVLADASDALNETLDPEVALLRILDVVVPRIASWSIVFLGEGNDDGPRIVTRHGDPTRQGDLERLVAEEGESLAGSDPVQQVLRERRALKVPFRERPDGDAQISDVLRDLGTGDVVIVPMEAGGSTLGVLAVVLDPVRGTYDADDVILLTDLGRRCGLALGNARRFDRERRIALELQHSLLPQLPAVAGIESCGHYEPAAHDVEIGGDWYDLIDVDENTVVAVIGDVTGHNIAAAAVMGRLYGAIRSYTLEGHGPDSVLSQIDRTASHLVGGLLATCCVVRFRRRAAHWSLEIANAGHPPPLLLRANCDVELAPTRLDPLLGLLHHRPQRGVTAVDVSIGDTVVLYTDGLVERRTENIDTGLARLVTAGRRTVREPIGSVCKRLVEELEPDGRDDLAVLAIRLT
jgi:GAF domain-containing protein